MAFHSRKKNLRNRTKRNVKKTIQRNKKRRNRTQKLVGGGLFDFFNSSAKVTPEDTNATPEDITFEITDNTTVGDLKPINDKTYNYFVGITKNKMQKDTNVDETKLNTLGNGGSIPTTSIKISAATSETIIGVISGLIGIISMVCR